MGAKLVLFILFAFILLVLVRDPFALFLLVLVAGMLFLLFKAAAAVIH